MFHIIILNNQRLLYEGTALSAILPGEEEEISILPFHSPLIGRLRRGMITVSRPSSEDEKSESVEEGIVIKGGIARMSKNELVVLVE